MMRTKVTVLAAMAVLAGCSGPSGESQSSADGPAIAPSAAPGVAFTFGYDYSLDDERIARVQEAHAAACEKLTLARCRISGMNYRIDDMDRVTAMLEVRLAPAIARGFGKQATALVEDNDGRLVSAEFAGDDVGSQIGAANARQSADAARIAELERRLAGLGAGDRERAELQRQLDELKARQAETAQGIAAGQAQLAATPMTFNYYGAGGIAGFDRNPVREAWRLSVASAVAMTEFVLKAVGVLLPWALLGLLLVLIWRSWPMRRVRQWWNGLGAKDDAAA